MSVAVRPTPRLHVGEPEVALDAGWTFGQEISASYYMTNYDSLPGGGFLMVRNDPGSLPMSINVIFNWFEVLKQRVPLSR